MATSFPGPFPSLKTKGKVLGIRAELMGEKVCDYRYSFDRHRQKRSPIHPEMIFCFVFQSVDFYTVV